MLLNITNYNNRQPNDLYATRPHDVELLYKYEPSIIEGKIWECACGHGHISKTLIQLGATDVYSSDLIDYGYGDVSDFLTNNDHKGEFDTILTNPPYKYGMEFMIHALDQVKDSGRVIMLLPTLILAGVNRYNKIFKDNPPKYVYVFVRNTYALLVAKGKDARSSTSMSHSWLIWEKGYKGEPTLRWLYEELKTEKKKRVSKNKSKNKRAVQISSSGVHGVRKRGNTYEARIKVNGKYIYLGSYINIDDAINARKQAELKYRGGENE